MNNIVDLHKSVSIEKNQGEINIIFNEPIPDTISFKDIGLSDEDLYFESGHIRIKFDFSKTNGVRKFYDIPTFRIEYYEKMSETHWICDFNEKTILDKTDHYGHSTVLLMKRKEIESAEHHHSNALLLHAEFPKPVHLKADKSDFHFFRS